MSNILFRADAEKLIGAGDLMSLIYLSKYFQRNNWNCFFAARDYKPASHIIATHNLKNVFLIPQEGTLKYEISFIKDVCQENKIDCLLMEITRNNLAQYESLGRPTLIKACVNFDGVITDDFDIVINWCVEGSSDLYSRYRQNDIQFILGFENSILPDYFVSSFVPLPKDNAAPKRILITMGGSDEFDTTAMVLKFLSCQHNENDEFHIILGVGYENYTGISGLLESKFRNFIIKYDASDLYDEYRWADIAFSAGGLTSSELVAAKVPAILIATQEHQIKRCKYYSQNGWAYFVGFYKNITESGLVNSFNYLKNNINEFRANLSGFEFRGGNEKIYQSIDSRRQ